jgi:hypothetical protein
MGLLFKLGGLLDKAHRFTKFFVVCSDVLKYASDKFTEAYPPELAPKEEEVKETEEHAK